ncbi:hypothetical protein ACN38_g4245 [Penicillium nordicum]|uniref:Uncharacterized protein n=1 Tax=Penicillium nordicum TaxID=229535 RepID=A0A0M9WH98_9EURO|nr:hypothetical protein ACN38_g4245 [Penicillium nordicum]
MYQPVYLVSSYYHSKKQEFSRNYTDFTTINWHICIVWFIPMGFHSGHMAHRWARSMSPKPSLFGRLGWAVGFVGFVRFSLTTVFAVRGIAH